MPICGLESSPQDGEENRLEARDEELGANRNEEQAHDTVLLHRVGEELCVGGMLHGSLLADFENVERIRRQC